MKSIPEIGHKIKGLWDDVAGEWGIAMVVILAVGAAFGLGRLSVLMSQKKPILLENTASVGVLSGENLPSGGMVVASKSGDVYYFPWCTHVRGIAPEAQRWFASEEQAQKAGYRPAKNCRGLE